MKKILLTLILIGAILTLPASAKKQLHEIGYWQQDADGLPAFVFTGALPNIGIRPDGKAASIPDNPWFLLGNYRLTVFTHADGSYELISGEREWARMNQGEKANSGDNQAMIEILDKDGNTQKGIPLVGMNTVGADRKKCQKTFGCGYASYRYQTDGLDIERRLAVSPSTRYDNGISAMMLTVHIRNTSRHPVSLRYTEQVKANYVPIFYQRQEQKPLAYQSRCVTDEETNTAQCEVSVTAPDPLMIPARERMSIYDGYPPVLYLKVIGQGKAGHDSDNHLSASSEFTLEKNGQKTLTFIIGYTFNPSDIRGINAGSFAGHWKEVLPLFEKETDNDLRREMIWHAYTLEAMATYSDYYKETKIPQGTIYDYYWGQHASARDNFQHAMPLVYYNPELCKSVMRYMAKRTTPMGDIRLIEYGNGFADNMVYCTSDQQLFFFQLLAEYLRVTGDLNFLNEEVMFFPIEQGAKATILQVVEKCFMFLRYNIGTGPHGLVKLLNSDWNDNVFVMNSSVYNNVIFNGESLMNTTMAIAILQNLIPSLDRFPQATPLVQSMKSYERQINDAFLRDLGNRTFPHRMYFDGKGIGENDMWLEPMGYLLQIKDFPLERKQALYHEMQRRVYSNEKLGARQQEAPQQEVPGLEKGSRENGGIWYSLNGPVIAGMKEVDKDEAWRLLHKMTFKNNAAQFPQYWTSYWSSSDNVESSLMGAQEGLADQSWDYWAIPIYCAHPHAWLLYCYYKLTE